MTLVLSVLLLLQLTVPLGAHDGHGEVSILTGSVRSVERDRVEIETLDHTTLQRKNVWILLDAKTKFLVGKNRVNRLDLVFGQRVESTVRSEHARDDSIQFRAMQVRVKEPKKSVSATR